MFAPLTSQLFARPGSGFRSGAAPRRMIGSLMLPTTSADVVSVARPGSSDGGSLPIARRSVPPDAFAFPFAEPVVCVPPWPLLLLPPPPQPAAIKARARSAMRPRGQASVRFRMLIASWACLILSLGLQAVIHEAEKSKSPLVNNNRNICKELSPGACRIAALEPADRRARLERAGRGVELGSPRHHGRRRRPEHQGPEACASGNDVDDLRVAERRPVLGAERRPDREGEDGGAQR